MGKVTENLKAEHCSYGSIPDQNFVGSYPWVFGKMLKNEELII
jgi:hypothetical protein